MPDKKSQKLNNKEYYFHIYNNGVENRNLFNDQQDYDIFLGYLKNYLTPPPDSETVKKTFSVKGRTYRGIPHQPKNYFNEVELIAYSLMPDHFHLLLSQKLPGSLEKLIRSLCTRYAIYYNKKYQRSGSLFSGPYKKVDITDVSELLYLTRNFHLESMQNKHIDNNINYVYSSYPDYLGVRNTSWIYPNTVLSYFDKTYDKSSIEKGNYKNFVETYALNQKEKKILERIIFKCMPKRLEKRDLKAQEDESFKDVSTKPVSKPKSNVAKFAFLSTAIFVVLFSIGLRNVLSSITEDLEPKQESVISTPEVITTPQVSGLEDEASDLNVVHTSSPSSLPEITPTPQVSGLADEKLVPKNILVIKIDDKSSSVNIRKEPATDSEIVGRAKDGDTFEFISKVPGWYQIKLDDGTAYVSENLVVIKEEEAN